MSKLNQGKCVVQAHPKDTELNAQKQVPVLDMRAFTGEMQPVANEAEPAPTTLTDFEHLRVTSEKHYPNTEPVITWDGAGIAAPGNITGISAAAKAGKTAFTGVLIAGAVSDTGFVEGFANINVKPNEDHKAVIHFDSEQSEDDQQYNVKTVLKRTGDNVTPAWFLSYNIRQLTFDKYQPVTDAICEAANFEFGGIHLIVIDGGADYTTSVNDEEQAYKIVEYFTHLSIRYQCPVIVVVHLNPGSDKERGHFGSQVQRKCYGLLTIKKENDISIAEPKIMRKAGTNDLQPIHYKYSKESGYHVQIDAPDREQEKADRQFEYLKQVAKDVFGVSAFKHDEAVKHIMKHTRKSESTCKTYLKNMYGWDIISKGTDNHYRQIINEKG